MKARVPDQGRSKGKEGWLDKKSTNEELKGLSDCIKRIRNREKLPGITPQQPEE